MYRAVTWHVLEHGVDPDDSDRMAELAESARITCDLQNNESRILIDDVDPADHLRDDRVNDGVASVSRVPRVREILVAKMRDYARDHDLVMEGRDIGSVVFPGHALTSFTSMLPPEVRSQRRGCKVSATPSRSATTPILPGPPRHLSWPKTPSSSIPRTSPSTK